MFVAAVEKVGAVDAARAGLARLDALPNFQDISTDQYRLTQDDRWKTYFLLGYGFQVDEHLARCPETAAALAAKADPRLSMFDWGMRMPAASWKRAMH